MSKLLPKIFKEDLPKLGEQEGRKDPNVHAVFHFSLSGWTWFATEGKPVEDDFLFFGYVIGFEREWGYFCLSELESVDVKGVKVCRDEEHEAKPLSACLQQYGFPEN